MKIDVLMYGVLFLGATIGIFYCITILLQKIIQKIRSRRRIRYDNPDVDSNNTKSYINNTCGIKSSKAILKAKEKMRGK